MGLARAARTAWAFLSQPDVRAGRACSKREVSNALDACVSARLGKRLLEFAGGCSPPDVAPRAVSVEVVNRVLRGISDGVPRVGLLWGARCVPWTTRDHPFVCDGATRQVVREVLLMLCRCLGSTTGSQMAIRVLQLVFAPEEKVGASPPRARVGDNLFDAEEAALELRPASVGPSPCVVPAPPRVRFGFLLQPGDAHEGRTCAK
jgi:hypothetical protein